MTTYESFEQFEEHLKSIEEQALVKHQLENSNQVLMNVHSLDECLGDYCTIHNMSDHHMRSWRQHWRADWGFMERICEHGIGHPDPDEYLLSIRPGIAGVHGCDGCCKKGK